MDVGESSVIKFSEIVLVALNQAQLLILMFRLKFPFMKKILRGFVWCQLWLAFISIRAAATTYYVDYVGGGDANNGTASATPWKHCPGDPSATGNAASTTLAGDDTVVFKGSVSYVFTGPFSSTSGSAGIAITAGTSGHPIHYDGNSAGTFGTGKATLTDDYSTNYIVAFYASGNMSHCTFSNFDIGPLEEPIRCRRMMAPIIFPMVSHHVLEGYNQWRGDD